MGFHPGILPFRAPGGLIQAKARLKPDGVLAQWVQTYNFSVADYLMIVRTLRSVFPHCGLLSMNEAIAIVMMVG